VQDEVRIGQKGTLTYIWSEKGKRSRAVRDQRYECAYIFGAVCPARGVGAALVIPSANTHAMNAHLIEISSQVAEGAHAIVIIDGAGWHTTKSLVAPDNISLLRRPAYSPKLSPQENIWQYLRQNAPANRVYETYDDIAAACCKAWNDLIDLPNTIKSIASREWF
jgi:transposase